MEKNLTKVLTLLFLAACLIFLTGRAQAQEGPLVCGDIDLIVDRFLPEGVSFEQATEEQIDSAIYQGIVFRPGAVERIVSCSCVRRPDKAGMIVFAAVRAQPEKKDDIVAAAKKAAPPEQAASIERAGGDAFDFVSNLLTQEETVARGYSFTYQEWSPIPSREDRPASPFAP
jgi:hypothetical protein